MNVEHFYDQALAAYRNENYEYAIELLNASLELNDSKVHIYELLGDCLFKIGAYEDAIANYSMALDINPHIVDVLVNLGQCYFSKNEFDTALPYYQRAIELIPNHSYGYFHLAKCYARMEDYENAIANFLYAIQFNPESEVPYFRLAKIYLIKEDYALSVHYSTIVSRLKPNWVDPYLILARAYAGMQDYNHSIANFIIAIEKVPDVESLYVELANVYINIDNNQEAIKCLLEASSINPDSPLPYEELGELFFKLKDYNKALHYWKKGLVIDPGSIFINERLGKLHLRLENFSEALSYFITALKNGLEIELGYRNLAHCYFELSDLQLAEDYYLKIIEFEDVGAFDYNDLGICLLKRGDYTRAIQYLKMAIDTDPDLYAPYFNIADHYLMQNQYTEAKHYFDLASEREGFKGHQYISMYYLPQYVFEEGEPWGFIYILKAIQEDNNKFTSAMLQDLLLVALENEASLLFYHLLGNMYFDTPEIIIKRPDFNEVARLSKPFRQQFTLWESNRKVEDESLLTEALLNFYMGNPIRSYQIFKDRIERNAVAINLMSDYYFVLSARAIGKNEGSYLESNVLPEVYKILNNTASRLVDRYYAALILELVGETANAIGQLEYLSANNYEPAYYALTQFKRTLFVNESDYQERVLNSFSDWHLARENYFRTPSVISLDENEGTLVSKLLPLLQLMENKAVLENLTALRNNPNKNIFEQRFFFSRYIQFTHLKELVQKNDLEKNNPIIYEKIYGNDEERELIETEILIFQLREKNQKGVQNIVTDIHKGTFTDYIYIKENLILPPDKTNYRPYMTLVITLQERGLIDHKTLFLLQQYITYCAETVYHISGKNEVLNYALSKLKEQIFTFSLFGLSFDDLAQIYSLASNKTHGIKSEVLSYQEFIEVARKEENLSVN